MNLTLYRKWPNTQPGKACTIGELYVDGVFFCYTLEDQVRAEGVKVKHETAIPFGKYRVVIAWSNRFQKPMPRLLNVPMFDGILIHAGNTAADTDGCILVGKQRGDGRITESRSAFAALFNRLAQSVVTEQVWIEIRQAADFSPQSPQVAPKIETATLRAPTLETSKSGPVAHQIPAFPVIAPSGLSPRWAENVTPPVPSRAVESLASGNTLPVFLAVILAAARDFLVAHQPYAIAAIVLTLLIVAWFEFRPRKGKAK